jgi:hypothetical protein
MSWTYTDTDTYTVIGRGSFAFSLCESVGLDVRLLGRGLAEPWDERWSLRVLVRMGMGMGWGPEIGDTDGNVGILNELSCRKCEE